MQLSLMTPPSQKKKKKFNKIYIHAFLPRPCYIPSFYWFGSRWHRWLMMSTAALTTFNNQILCGTRSTSFLLTLNTLYADITHLLLTCPHSAFIQLKVCTFSKNPCGCSLDNNAEALFVLRQQSWSCGQHPDKLRVTALGAVINHTWQ